MLGAGSHFWVRSNSQLGFPTCCGLPLTRSMITLCVGGLLRQRESTACGKTKLGVTSDSDPTSNIENTWEKINLALSFSLSLSFFLSLSLSLFLSLYLSLSLSLSLSLFSQVYLCFFLILFINFIYIYFYF